MPCYAKTARPNVVHISMDAPFESEAKDMTNKIAGRHGRVRGNISTQRRN